MKKLTKILFIVAIVNLCFIFPHNKTSLVVAGVSGPEISDDFAIYLTERISKTEKKGIDLNEIPLQEKPVISIDDINAYYWDSHILKVKKSTLNSKLAKVRIYGGFVVVAKGIRVYLGGFWFEMLSSVPQQQPFIYEENLFGFDEEFVRFYCERYKINIKCDSDERLILIHGDTLEMNDERIYTVLKENQKLIEVSVSN